ncbi:MAG: hypothetical protein ACRC1T_04910 [Clostridium chrysemydis]|uniref:hypothetical protein n=1 Tax=Clostridium chrysemydis TaxID=2665504 RepID=UPI003F2FA2F2
MVATEAAMTMGLSVAITFLIEQVSKFIDKVHVTKAELKEMNSDFINSSKQVNETINTAEEKYSKIKDLQSQINNTSDANKKIELQSQLNKLQAEMVDLLPKSANGYSSEGEAIANNNALIEESIKLKRDEREETAKKVARENSKHMDVFDKYFENKNNYQNMTSSSSIGLNQFQKALLFVSGNRNAIKKADTQEVNKEMQEQLNTITSIKKAVDDMKKSGMSDLEIKAQFSGIDVFEKIKEFDASLQNTKNDADNVKPSLDEISNPLDKIKESANGAAESLDKLGSKFNKLNGNISLVKKAMEEFSKTGKVSSSTIGSMLSSGDTRVISLLKDRANFMKNSADLEKVLRGESQKTYEQALAQSDNLRQQGITDLSSKEAIDKQAEQSAINSSNNSTNAKLNNYATDVNAQADAEGNKNVNSANGANARTNTVKDETNQKTGMYGEDAKNHGELEGTKVTNSTNAANSMLDVNGQMINGFANGYSADANNFQKLMNDKLDMADACATQLDWTFAQVFKQTQSLSKAVRETMMAKEGLGTSMDIPKKPSILEMGSWNPIYKGQHSVNSGFDPLEVNSDLVGADYDSVEPDYSNGGKGASANKKKKDKKKNEVDIKDIEDKIDAYKSLQDSIDDVNNELEETKTLEEQANGSEKLKYMNQKLVLYKKKKQAINDIIWQKKQEAKALEEILKNNGFDASSGNISNYTQRLEAIKDNVNAMDNSNKAKEQAIKDYKELKEKADKYFELTSKEIPNLNNQWKQLNKTIREVSENQVKLMGDTEREMTSIVENEVGERRKILEEDLEKQEEEFDKKEKLLEKQTNKVKEELQKQRDEYNKKNDDESFERNLKEKQNELNKINSQIDSTRRDNSSDGQSRLKELLSKKEEIEKDLNNIIRDRQKQKGDELFEESMKQIDKNNQDASDKLNKEKEDFSKQKEEILKKFDEKYNKETISELAKGMISKGFIEIEGHVIKLRDALNDYYKTNGEVFADSSLKMQEYIDNLELTKKLYQELASINNNLGVSSSNIRYNSGNNVVPSIPRIASFMAIPKRSRNPNIDIKTDLHIGTVNEGNMDDVKRLIDERDRSIVNKITSQLHVH